MEKRKDIGRYAAIFSRIFQNNYVEGSDAVYFDREDITTAAKQLGIAVPKNLGDVIYAYKFRRDFEDQRMQETQPDDRIWMIYTICRSKYAFLLKHPVNTIPNPSYARIKIPDATPGIVAKYATTDEQALLTRVRYNRLIDIFTGTTCYSLQNHLRSSIKGPDCPGGRQVESDEVYVGVDKFGVQYAFPVQAKGNSDKIGLQQIEDDIALCNQKLPDLICRPIGVQFFGDVIALFEFQRDDDRMAIVRERHYCLVPHDQVTQDDLLRYRQSLSPD